jgi:HEAT repeat protein
VAAQELAELGDDAGVPVLLEQLSLTKDNRHIEASLAFARLSRQDAIELLLAEAKNNPHPEAYAIIVWGLRESCQRQIASLVLDHMQNLLSQKSKSVNEIEMDVNILAPIVRVVPPLEVTDISEMRDFVTRAEAWCKGYSE